MDKVLKHPPAFASGSREVVGMEKGREIFTLTLSLPEVLYVGYDMSYKCHSTVILSIWLNNLKC